MWQELLSSSPKYFIFYLNSTSENDCFSQPDNLYVKIWMAKIYLNENFKFDLISELAISKIVIPGFGHYYFRLKILTHFFYFVLLLKKMQYIIKCLIGFLCRIEYLGVDYSWLWSSVQLLIQETQGTKNYQYKI